MTKAMYTTNNGIKEEILIGSDSEFYKDIAERLIKESVSNGTRVKVNVDVPDEGDASYMVSQRSGTMFITETGNNMPDKFLDKEIKPRFLTCVNPETNAYKFYKLDVLDDKTVRASYGRMGVKKGELFGERSFDYPLSMYWIKYYEKIQKGYVDRTDIYLTDSADASQEENDKSNKKATAKVDSSTASYKLFQKLKRFAKKAVEEAEVKVPLSRTIINESKKLLDEMRAASDVDTFNNYLLELIAILQRPVRTGDGTGVKRIMAGNSNDFARIILREADLIQAMEGSLNHTGRGPIVTSDFTKYGIEVYEATEKQKKQVLEHLSDRLKGKVKHVYRVIPQEQQKIFNDYLKEHQIHKVKQLWHGSRNQNWMSIIQNSLKLNPDAIITGKMFGHGIYFAPSSMKSWNYTSYRGTSWANGNSDCAFMGLYAVAYGATVNDESDEFDICHDMEDKTYNFNLIQNQKPAEGSSISCISQPGYEKIRNSIEEIDHKIADGCTFSIISTGKWESVYKKEILSLLDADKSVSKENQDRIMQILSQLLNDLEVKANHEREEKIDITISALEKIAAMDGLNDDMDIFSSKNTGKAGS